MNIGWQTPPRRRYPTIEMEEVNHKREKKPVKIRYEIPEIRYGRGRYSGEALREIRKQRGVGRPPKVLEENRRKFLERIGADVQV